jgi:structural maintenance of chromosome 3 (chondroitin sulfate proteoglycan 6)
MLQRLKFDDKYRPAFKQVFRKSLIVRDLTVGSRFSKSHDLDCVTIDGDQVNRKGALTGGYLDARRSRLQAQADIKRLTTQRAAYEVQLGAEQKQLQEVDGQVTSLLGKLKQTEASRQRAEAAAEQEALDLPAAGSDARGGASSPDADAQKEEALRALQAAAQAERQRLDAVTGEAASEFTDGLSAAESRRRGELQASLATLQKALVAAERQKNKATQAQAQLETELREHLLKRQEELQASLATDALEETRTESEGAAEALAAAQEKLASVEGALGEAQRAREQKAVQERALQKQVEELRALLAAERGAQADEAKELDRLLTRKTLLLGKVDEFNDGIRRLGSLPKDAFDADRTQSSKQLMATIAKCQQSLQGLTHVNKKALDQFANFSDQRDKLIERQAELDEAEASIRELIAHLDHKKDEAIERTFKLASRHFLEVFKELVPGGSGKLVMQTNVLSETAAAGATAATRVAQYSGVKVQVAFTGGGKTLTMEELSGGQKTMAALCLIFAIQRCDPAPFYIFDEVDANLDAAHRASLAHMIAKQSSDVDDNGDERPPTQFITTTFRPELIHAGDQFYGVTHRGKASTVKTITKEEALRIISETASRSKQHVGGKDN